MKTDIYSKDLQFALEDWVDRFSLEAILNALSDICEEKAEHLEANWQDHDAAKTWIKDSKQLNKIAERLQN